MLAIPDTDVYSNKGLIGKTVLKHIKHDGGLLIVFTDSTYLYIKPELSDEDGSAALDFGLWLLSLRKEKAVELGLCTPEEYEKQYADYTESNERRNKEYKRQQYEKLKKEFEPTQVVE